MLLSALAEERKKKSLDLDIYCRLYVIYVSSTKIELVNFRILPPGLALFLEGEKIRAIIISLMLVLSVVTLAGARWISVNSETVSGLQCFGLPVLLYAR